MIDFKSGKLTPFSVDGLKWSAAEQAALLSLNVNGVIGSHMGGYPKRVAWFEKCKLAGFLDDKMHFTGAGQTFVAMLHPRFLCGPLLEPANP